MGKIGNGGYQDDGYLSVNSINYMPYTSLRIMKNFIRTELKHHVHFEFLSSLLDLEHLNKNVDIPNMVISLAIINSIEE